jgi:heme-degrading monooxygenase HmoA
VLARKVLIKLKERNQEFANRVADQLAQIYQTIPELQAVHFISNDEASEYGSITVWDSREAMESSFSKLREKVEELVGEQYAGISVEVYEVYKPL